METLTDTIHLPTENIKFSMGEYVFELDPGPPTGKFIEIARRELRETPENITHGINELSRLIAKLQEEENLNFPSREKYVILPYLRNCKYYPESAFKKIQNRLKIMQKYPKYFKDLVPTSVGPAIRSNVLQGLPLRDQHGRRILALKMSFWDPSKLSLTELVRAVLTIIDVGSVEEKTQIAGAVVILDFEGLTFNQIWQFTPTVAKIILEWIQECIPVRLKGVHIVNQPFIFNMLFNIFKPFIGAKLRSRIHFHGTDWNSLAEHIEPKALPTQYGGEMKFEFVHGPAIHDMMMKFNEPFEILNSYGYEITGKDKKKGKK